MPSLSPTLHTTRRGLRLPLAGSPEQRVEAGPSVLGVEPENIMFDDFG